MPAMSTDPASFERARRAFEAGLAAQQAGRLDEAEALYRQSLAALPGRATTLCNLGATLLALGRAEEALVLLNQALARTPGQPEASAHRAEALLALGRHDEALAAFSTLIEAQGAAAPARARLRRAELQARLGAVAQALPEAAALAAEHPGWAEAQWLHGSLLKDLGRGDEALAPLSRAHTLGSPLAGWLHAALAGDPAAPGAPPAGYVEALFDSYAAQFDQHLAETLDYRAPELLGLGLAGRRFESALDLGCGTGLAAAALHAHAGRWTGVDLSAAMLDAARQRGLYTELHQADLLDHLQAMPAAAHDLVLAADVFIYLGELDAVFAGVRHVLAPGGVFGFTVEPLHQASNTAWALLPSARYAHAPGYLRKLAAAHSLVLQREESHTLRLEQGRPLVGHYVWLGG